MPDDAATVLDIVLACRRLNRFIGGADESAFLRNEEKHWAVVSQLMLIGEASRRLSEQFCGQHSTVPWRQIAAMRNRLVHGYDVIDWPLVWTTAHEDIPKLLAELEPLVPEERDDAALP
jgi:uncharacterized protein with HEPN domain